MPNHGHYGNTSDIRYIEDEWYRRCPDCQKADRQCWWPLDLEYWWPRSMQRCRACNLTKKRAIERHRNRLARGKYDDNYRRTHRDQINARRRQRRREQNAKRTTTRVEEPTQAA